MAVDMFLILDGFKGKSKDGVSSRDKFCTLEKFAEGSDSFTRWS
jgi:hypothetical protein